MASKRFLCKNLCCLFPSTHFCLWWGWPETASAGSVRLNYQVKQRVTGWGQRQTLSLSEAARASPAEILFSLPNRVCSCRCFRATLYCYFGIFDPIYLSSVTPDGMSLTSDGSSETCFAVICPRLRKHSLIYVLPCCFSVCEEGEGKEQKWIQIQTWRPSWSKFTSEKRCQTLEIQIWMHSNFSWNRRRGIGLTQLVWFHHLSPTHSCLGFFFWRKISMNMHGRM